MQRPNLPPQQPVHHQIQIGGQIRLACGRSRRIGADHKQATCREHAKVPAHEHTKTTPHTVAHHRGANRATDYESYPGWLTALTPHKKVAGHERPPGAGAAAHREREVRAVPHPGFAGKHVRATYRRGRSGVSGAEARAALVAPRREHGTARTGAHAQPEAVGLRPAAVVRLERALAHRSSRWVDRLTGRRGTRWACACGAVGIRPTYINRLRRQRQTRPGLVPPRLRRRQPRCRPV